MGVSISSLQPNTAEWSLAINVIIIGVALAGIAIGIGRAMQSRRLWAWGVEELAQAVINAAMLGVLISWVVATDALTASWVDSTGLHCPELAEMQNKPLYFFSCAASQAQAGTLPVISQLSALSYKFGWLSDLTINANVITSKPFSSFSDVASTYWSEASVLSSLLSLIQIHSQFLALISQSAFAIFLPTGLLLRMFFATRKLGGAIMAAAIGFYIVYPLAYSSLLAPSQLFDSLSAAHSSLEQAANYLAAVPIADLGKSGDVAVLVANLSGGDLPVLSTLAFQPLAAAKASLALAFIVYPLISLALTLVAIRELYLALSAEFNLNLFEIM